MNAYKNPSYTGFILYLIGIVLIVYGLTNLARELDLDQKGVKATGTVFDLSVTQPYRQAMVRFQTGEGATVVFLDKLFWNNIFKTYSIGDEVEVIYDPADPEKTAVINEFFQRNTEPWWPVILGLVVMFVGWIMRRIMLKKARIFEGQRNGTIAVDPDAGKKSLNRTMLITFVAVCVIILILVAAFGVFGK
jgi:hypothetical protein